MEKWRCSVCGFIHEGENPPLTCPVCGVNADDFQLVGENTAQGIKRWKCTVCDYIHSGDLPPDSCPLCGAPKEAFVLICDGSTRLQQASVNDTDEATARSALFKVSYGLYVLATEFEGRLNGQCVNSLFQLTDRPLKIAVSLNNDNFTCELLKQSGVFSASILGKAQLGLVRHFGYQSGRVYDKFAEIEYVLGKNGCPILQDSIAFLEARVITEECVNVGTHTLFVCEVTSGQVFEESQALTYSYYRRNRN